MKKTYINPEMEIVKIETNQMLAGSDVNTSNSEPTKWGSRGYDWNEDDE